MKKNTFILTAAWLLVANIVHAATVTNATEWLSRPLSLADALNTALVNNATILKAKNDLEASHGIVVQTRAVALPQLQATGQYKYTDPNSVDKIPQSVTGSAVSFVQANQSWNSGIQLVQNIYMGGRMVAAIRAADVTKRQALAVYQTAVTSTLLAVRLAYYDVLLAAQQISVREASVKLLQKELEDQQHRFDAGTVAHFNVLRAEVAVANERPALITARNAYRNAKNLLVNALGYDLPREVFEDVPLNLTDSLDTAPFDVNLPDAIQQALTRRTELAALREDVKLQNLNIVDARSGYKPTVGIFAGYGFQSSQFTEDLSQEVDGWNVGAQLSWAIFDGGLTYGKVIQAKALYAKSKTTLAEQSRQIELDVRVAYSDFIQAREILESQSKVQEQADEALRESNARSEAGTGTQLDVLNSETALTQSRNTQLQAQHDYAAARARLERAIGADLAPAK